MSTQVVHTERDEPEWKSWEVFLPVMTLVGDGSASVALNVLSNIIYDRYVGKSVPEPVVNYEVFDETITRPDGTETRRRLLRVSEPASAAREELHRIIDGMNLG